MVDRNLHPEYVPTCFSHVAPVDRYLWPTQDSTNMYLCHNGIFGPIYANNGNLAFTLPLEEYPKENEISPYVIQSQQGLHFPRRYQAREGFYDPRDFGAAQ